MTRTVTRVPDWRHDARASHPTGSPRFRSGGTERARDEPDDAWDRAPGPRRSLNRGRRERHAEAASAEPGQRAEGWLVTRLDRLGPSADDLRWWTAHEPALAGVASFDDLRAEMRDRACPNERKDARLAALLRLTLRFGNGPAVAVLVLMVPGMAKHVRQFAPGLDPDTAWAAITAGMYERIRLHAPNQPPSKVASNLLWPATNVMIRELNVERAWARRHAPLDHTPADQPAPQEADDLSPEMLLGLAVDAGVLSPAEAALIGATRFGGLSLPEAAQLLGITPEAAKKRRQRAEPKWLDWWLDGLDGLDRRRRWRRRTGR